MVRLSSLGRGKREAGSGNFEYLQKKSVDVVKFLVNGIRTRVIIPTLLAVSREKR